ncbi:MAG: hypothetical protein ACRDZ8_05880 [Acidimicrobiales bacterium]
MVDLLKAVAVLALVVLLSFGVVVALTMRALTRANRVSRKRPSGAPLSWLISPRAPARLHRRLRRAVDASNVVVVSLAPGAVPLRQVAEELVARAVVVDDWLVAADGIHPAGRSPRLTQLAGEVREIETSAARLHHLGYDWRRSVDQAAALQVPPPDLHQRLDAVEAALRDLPTIATTPPALVPHPR